MKSKDSISERSQTETYSTTTSIVAEKLVHDLGQPRDYDNKRCKCIYEVK